MKRRDYEYILFYITISLLVMFLFIYFNLSEYESFKNSFFNQPFDICRVIENHTYKDNFYGGLINYISYIGFQLIVGIGIFAFSFIATYFADIYLFKRYFFQDEKIKNGIIISKQDFKDKGYFFFIIPLPPMIYDFLPFIFFNEKYNCLEIIRYVESTW
jgi:hypothetical protein